VLLKFFNGVNLLKALAKVRGAATVTREALLKVTRSDNYKSITSMPSKDIQYML
jgi:hypothetical protein